MTTLAVDTPHGRANVHLRAVDEPIAALVLGHGAGGGVTARDLVTVTAAARASAVSVALVEQPYRVAGRRTPAPARQLDGAWTAVVEHLLAVALRGLPHVVGGRSSGARVACRTAHATDAVGVLCLAFPLQPPPRRSAAARSPSRLPELDGVTVPTLVVQGARDPFGIPPAGARRTVVQVSGDHSLRTDLPAIAAAVGAWLPRVVEQAARAAADRRPSASRLSDTAGMTERNVLGGELEPCGTDPMTGFYRDGCCSTGPEDLGSHTICAVVTAEFLAHQRAIGNDLSTPMPHYHFPGLVPGDRWCVTAVNWLRAHQDGAAAYVVLASTHERALDIVALDALREHAVDVPADPGTLGG